jgi:hypothetical protein
MRNLFDRINDYWLTRRIPRHRFGQLLASVDFETGRVLEPEYVRRMRWQDRMRWRTDHGLDVAIGGATNYSWLQMQQPYQVNDAVAVTAAAETVVSQDTYFTLPANFFAFPGQTVWFHAAGKESNVVTTPGTYTWRLRYAGVSGTILGAGGAIVPDPVAVTDNLWTCDIYVKALAIGQLTTSLTLLTYGRVDMANADASLASDKAKFIPGGGTSLANVASLDGTIAKALTLTTTPTVATGSVTMRDGWIVAMN